MLPQIEKLGGDNFIQRATHFMVQARQQDPLGGMWDAGDLNWWFRFEDFDSEDNQWFWISEKTLGITLIAGTALDYEFLPELGENKLVQAMFRKALARVLELSHLTKSESVVLLRESHRALRAIAETEGYRASGRVYKMAARELDASLHAPFLPDGYAVRHLEASDLSGGGTPVLHLTREAYERVARTPLYRQDMHLVVVSSRGRVAAECMCWLDEANAIGVIEPVRTHDDFQKRGLGRALLLEACRRMVTEGMRLAKTTYDPSSYAASKLYASVGFRDVFDRLEYVREG